MGGFWRFEVEIEAVSWVQHLVKNEAPCFCAFFSSLYLSEMLALGRSLNKLTLVSAPRIASGNMALQ